ncbi:MAG: hypothetical protein ACPIOQ_65725 [Promethearchaeia archaeon]
MESRSEGDNLCTRPDEFLRNIWNAATVVRVRLDVRWRTVGDLAPQLTHVSPEGCHVWTVFVFAIVVFVKMIASADVMTRGLDFQGKVLREGMEIDSEQEAALPDISDPAIRKELKCQLCQGVVMEMLQTIRGQEHELLRRLTEVEVVETLEKICSQVL